MENDRYDIQAEPPDNLRSGIRTLRYSWYDIEDETLRAMLQALLIDRFQLKVHRETKSGDVYRLERTEKPLRLRPTQPNCPAPTIGFAGRWVICDSTTGQVAKFAADYVLHAPVLDETGLSGSFDYWQPPPLTESETSDQLASFLELMREVGRRLERSKGPVEMLVIDHAGRPSPN